MEEATINDARKILLCPLCQSEFPLITFNYNLQVLSLSIKCICSSETQTLSLKDYLALIDNLDYSSIRSCSYGINHSSNTKGEQYCNECAKWLCKDCLIGHHSLFPSHTLTNLKSNFLCLKHSLSLKYYCSKCDLLLCQSCNWEEHKYHSLSLMPSLSFNYSQKIDSFLDKAQKEKSDIMNLIDEVINELVQIKESFKSKFEADLKQNLLLKKFASYLDLTIERNDTISQSLSVFTLYSNFSIQEYQSTNINRNDLLSSSIVKTKTLRLNNNAFSINNQKDFKATNFNQASSSALSQYAIPLRLPPPYTLHKLSKDTIAVASTNLFQLLNLKSFESSNSIQCERVVHLLQLDHSSMLTDSAHQSISIWDISNFKAISVRLSINVHITSPIIQLANNDIAFGIGATLAIYKSSTLTKIRESSLSCNDEIVEVIQLKDGRLVSISKLRLYSFYNEDMMEDEEIIDPQIVFWDEKTLVCLQIIELINTAGDRIYQLKNEDLLYVPLSNCIYDTHTYQVVTRLGLGYWGVNEQEVTVKGKGVLGLFYFNELAFYCERTFKRIRSLKFSQSLKSVIEYESNCFVYSTNESSNVFVLDVNLNRPF